MVKPIGEAIKSMINEDKDICCKCGGECEHGWNAHTILTPKGCVVICSDCDQENALTAADTKATEEE